MSHSRKSLIPAQKVQLAAPSAAHIVRLHAATPTALVAAQVLWFSETVAGAHDPSSGRVLLVTQRLRALGVIDVRRDEHVVGRLADQ